MLDEEKKVETTEQVQQESKSGDWDKERQRVDQLAANVTKLANDKVELTGHLTAMAEQSQELINKVQALEQQLSTKQEQQVTADNALDPDLYDDKLINAISRLKAEIGDTKKQLQESNTQVQSLLTARDKTEAEQKANAEAQRKAAVKENILSGLDEKYGAKYRNEALRLAQEAVTTSGKAPDDALSVYLLLEKQYLSLSKQPSTFGKFPSVPVDTGEGGVVFKEDEIKEGSRDEVLKNIWSKFKDRPFTMPSI